jgi:hypothetical protein
MAISILLFLCISGSCLAAMRLFTEFRRFRLETRRIRAIRETLSE